MKKAVKAKSARLAPLVQIVLVCLATYLGLFVILYSGITPEQYDLQIGMPAPTQIKATKDIQDTVTTEALRDQESAKVEPSYKSADPSVVDEVNAELTSLFDRLRSLREDYTTQSARSLTEAELAALSESLDMPLTRDALAILSETSEENLDAIFAMAQEMVEDALVSTLPEGQENAALKNIQAELSQHFSSQLASLAVEAVRSRLRPNMLIDEEITDANREKAREAVQTVWYVKDQVIVSEGEIVTEAQYTMISALGLLGDDSIDGRLMVGLAALILLIMLSIGFYLYQFNRDILKNPSRITLLCLILLTVTGLSSALRLVHPYLMPVSLGLLLVALLIDGRLALFVNLMLSLLVSTLASVGTGMFTFAMMSSISAPIIITLFSHKTLRTTTLLAGAIAGAGNFLITMAVGLINSAEMYDVVVNAGVAAGSGIVSAVLCIGILPVMEWLFNLATASKLIELSNPNQPLLRRLLLEASGTYHHSIIVANLAEAACSAIGANGLLARVGAYYHDIGKLKRPMYFKENQMGDNPHDRTDPRVSTAILTAHTRDGAQLAQKARIPEPVVDIIRQHHGDTPVMYFYDKALKLYGDQVDISAFRYEGPRPQSREAAVVMLADTIEAATRALPNPDPDKIDALIRKLVRGKLNDGQLDSSQLTFNDLDKICGAFSTVLTGVFHERIEYPDVVIPPRAEKPESPSGDAAEIVAGDTAAPSIQVPSAQEGKPSPQGQPVAPVQENSSQPVAKPAVTNQNPAPVTKPIVSAGQPAAPVQENSVQPAAKPAVNGQNPAPAAKPVVSAGQPAAPVQENSSQPAAKPAVASQKPIISAGQPAAPVQENSVGASKPVAPAQAASKEVKADGH